MKENPQSQSRITPEQKIPSSPKQTRVKAIIFSAVAGIFVVLISYSVVWYAKNKRSAKLSGPENWQDRFVYDAFNYAYPPPEKPANPDIRSVNLNGKNEKKHQVLCDGREDRHFWALARSPDGKRLAFLLPSKEQEANNPNWGENFGQEGPPFTQGSIYLFDLEKNTCQPLGITADSLYNQSMAFSPDGQYLAYVFYGLHLYNFSTEEDKRLTRDEGSAHFKTIITGPLLWNSTGSAIYTAISDGLSYQKGMPTSLYRIKINETEETSLPWSGQTGTASEKLAKKELVVNLADLYLDAEGKSNWQSGETAPDNPLIYAISPDEKWVAFQQDRSLIIKNLEDSTIKQVWEQRGNAEFPGEACAARLLSLTWAQNGWLYFSTSCGEHSSETGNIWGSFNGAAPEKLVRGKNFITNTRGDKIIYNFDYFGNYYATTDKPLSSVPKQEVGSAKHQYNGLGVYDILTKKDLKLSGKGRPSGFLLE